MLLVLGPKRYKHYKIGTFYLSTDFENRYCPYLHHQAESKSDSKAMRRQSADGEIQKRGKRRMLRIGTLVQVCEQ